MKFLSVAAYSICALSTCALADKAVTCGSGSTCPQDKPCCSQYGECGTGLYCLGACDIRHSFNSTSCMPLPVCESTTYNFNSADDILQQSKYLGDSSKYGWTTNGQVLTYNDNVLLTMAKDSYGTVISSTKAVWYGRVSASLMTSHGDGVVSAFILMSQAKDEIDYEFVGNNVDQAQTNFYWQGMLNYTNSGRFGLSSTNESFHTYEFDWTPDKIDWIIDGQTVRTLNREDTFNSSSQQYEFPQTPSIIQLSLWPGGSDKNPEGTVEWAGGPIDWTMPEFTKPGYLFVTLDKITVECYDPPADTSKSGSKAYSYKADTLLSSDVEITDDDLVLKSPQAVGFAPNAGGDDDLDKVSQVVPTNIGGNDGKKTSYQAVSKVSESSQSLVKVTGVMSKSSSAKPTKSSVGDGDNHSDADTHSNSGPTRSGAQVAANTASSIASAATENSSSSAAIESSSERAIAAMILCGLAGVVFLF